ncbi:MAG: antibiotic biosynthesis monooxygenase [Hyphomonadaceae bacterium]|nr:antibiotic biosynthesis monooxygenase [Hyphomonadaceae bacterium]
MLAIIWRYEVKQENAEAFERAYGAGGAWETLFSRSPAFQGTELLGGGTSSYATIDRWTSEADYDAFLRTEKVRYVALDAACAALADAETLIGRFETPPRRQ